MCARSRATLLALVCTALFAPAAGAQPQNFGPGYGPGVGNSGFNPNNINPGSLINLTPQGRNFNPGVQYLGIVKQQSNFGGAIQGLQSQNRAFSPFVSMDIDPNSPVLTGNRFGFQNYQYYFQNQFALGSFGVTGYGQGGFGQGGYGNRPGASGMGSGPGNLNPGAVSPPPAKTSR